MITEIGNDRIRVAIKRLGAELTGLRKAGDTFEYIWTGDGRYWTGQSPVLFPIVGSVRNEHTRIEGKLYELKNHGFARRREFEVRSCSGTEAVFALRADELTRLHYPYEFELRLIYRVEGACLTITYEVENTDARDIAFQLGTHPGFCCPMGQHDSLTDYVLEFEQPESATRYYCNASNLMVTNQQQDLLHDTTVLPLSPELFYDGALIFRHIRSQALTLKSSSQARFVKMKWHNFPYLGIWQPKDAPFVCIEPWHGVGDPDQGEIDFSEKEQLVTLSPGTVFRAYISIEV